MAIEFDERAERSAKLKVIGVGGAGGNAINTMVKAELAGVDFIAVNTDAQSLDQNKAQTRMQIGRQLTPGTRRRRKSGNWRTGDGRGSRGRSPGT